MPISSSQRKQPQWLASFQKSATRAVARSCSLGVADRLAARPFLEAFCLGKRDCTSGSLHPLGLIWTQGNHAQNELPRPCQADLASACKADYIRAPSSPPSGALRLVRGGTELAPSQIRFCEGNSESSDSMCTSVLFFKA